MFCKHCGKQIDDDSSFCSFCGADLRQSSSKPKTDSGEKKKQAKPVKREVKDEQDVLYLTDYSSLSEADKKVVGETICALGIVPAFISYGEADFDKFMEEYIVPFYDTNEDIANNKFFALLPEQFFTTDDFITYLSPLLEIAIAAISNNEDFPTIKNEYNQHPEVQKIIVETQKFLDRLSKDQKQEFRYILSKIEIH